VADAISILKVSDYDLIILETSGIGQSDTEILDHSDKSLYIMTPEYGAATQLEKIDMIDFADLIALNKFDKRGALDALRDIQKQYQRNHLLWDKPLEEMPVLGTMASQFNDPGTNRLYLAILGLLEIKGSKLENSDIPSEKKFIIPAKRSRYLSEIADSNRNYNIKASAQADLAQKLYGLYQSILSLSDQKENEQQLTAYGLDQEIFTEVCKTENKEIIRLLFAEFDRVKLNLDPYNWELIRNFTSLKNKYSQPEFSFDVRGKTIRIPTQSKTLAHTSIPKVSLPNYKAWGDLLKWQLQEMFLDNFRLPQDFSLLRELGKIPLECLPEKEAQSEPISVFTMFPWVCLQSDYLQLLTP
jgi:methylmalonyl-CoA mutase